MSALIDIIIADDRSLRDQALDTFCRQASLEQLLPDPPNELLPRFEHGGERGLHGLEQVAGAEPEHEPAGIRQPVLRLH